MAKTPSTMPELGMAAPPFSLPDTNGRTVSLDDFDGQPVLILFICNHCPYVIHIAEGLAALGRDYHRKGVNIVAINANDAQAYPADSPTAMVQEVKRRGYVFPYLHDQTQEVAKAYRAACTPDIYLFDADHRLVYRGQFDGSRPSNEVPVTGSDLRAALDALLEDRPIAPEQTPSIGCNIKWRAGNAPEYFG